MAISPELPDYSLTTKEKNKLEFLVLSDPEGTVAKQYNLVFKLPAYLLEIYQQFGLDVAGHNGNSLWELPAPATYIINQSGEIKYASVDPDYTKRKEPSEIVEILKN